MEKGEENKGQDNSRPLLHLSDIHRQWRGHVYVPPFLPPLSPNSDPQTKEWKTLPANVAFSILAAVTGCSREQLRRLEDTLCTRKELSLSAFPLHCAQTVAALSPLYRVENLPQWCRLCRLCLYLAHGTPLICWLHCLCNARCLNKFYATRRGMYRRKFFEQ